jgi:hypothetical protein
MNATIYHMMELYPDIAPPSLGSPFGTGNETFGLSSVEDRGCYWLLLGGKWKKVLKFTGV